MTTKQKFGLASIKKNMMRGKQKMSEKFGGAQKTVDGSYDTEFLTFKEYDELVNKIKKSEVEYIKVLRDLRVLEGKLALDVLKVFGEGTEMYQAGQEYKNTTEHLNGAREEMEQTIQRDFLEPLSIYLRQFGIMKNRHQERERRKIDMDRYKHDYKKGTEKGDSDKASSNKKKYLNMKNGYEALNEEMMHDFMHLHQDKEFFNALLATHIQATALYYSKTVEIMDAIWQWVMHVSREDIHTYASVITPEEESCWNKQVDLAAAVDLNEPIDRDSSGGAPPAKSMPAKANPARPPPSRPKGAVKKVPTARALYDFQGQDENELTFHAGDVITIIEAKEGEDWWTGELNGQRGLMPSNYVERD